MIFNVPGHIDSIRNGLYFSPTNHVMPYTSIPVKTQTRRVNRGIYQVGRDYAVQRKRGVKAEMDIRIVMDKIWIERYAEFLCCYISEEDALAEGGYTVIEFEELFRKLNPKWTGERWAFKFHIIGAK